MLMGDDSRIVGDAFMANLRDAAQLQPAVLAEWELRNQEVQLSPLFHLYVLKLGPQSRLDAPDMTHEIGLVSIAFHPNVKVTKVTYVSSMVTTVQLAIGATPDDDAVARAVLHHLAYGVCAGHLAAKPELNDGEVTSWELAAKTILRVRRSQPRA